MQEYIGVKIVNAEPMDENTFLETVKHEDVLYKETRPGYKVVYPDGYVSWCPEEQFLEANRPTTGMPFGMAIEAMRKGCKVARKGWNGKNMWIVYMSGMSLPPFNTQGTSRKVNDRTAKLIGQDTPLNTLPYIAMWTADKKWLPGWLASQTDMLADDWHIILDEG